MTIVTRMSYALAWLVGCCNGFAAEDVGPSEQPRSASVSPPLSDSNTPTDFGAAGKKGSPASVRDAIINRLRTADLGSFEYHDYLLGERQMRLAAMLAEG